MAAHPPVKAEWSAGLNTADSFKFNLGQYAIGFVGTCASWITMTVRTSADSEAGCRKSHSHSVLDDERYT